MLGERVRSLVRGVRASFVFLTRLPVGGWPYQPHEFRQAIAHAPLVGLVVGANSAAVFLALRPLGELPAAALSIGASLLMTGALHEDGLADTADALGGSATRERVLEILKDSRIGTFGAAALCLSLLARAALIARLGDDAWWALPLAGCTGRVAPVLQMVALPYVTRREESKSHALSGAGASEGVVACVWAAGACAAASAFGTVSAVRLGALACILIAITLFTGWRYSRRAGGVTGDFLGATEQIGEVCALAVFAWDLN